MFSSCTYGMNFKILQHLVPELFANLGVHTTNNGNPNEFIGRLDGFYCICEIEKSLSERPALGY